jgi:hypothetical protein
VQHQLLDLDSLTIVDALHRPSDARNGSHPSHSCQSPAPHTYSPTRDAPLCTSSDKSNMSRTDSLNLTTNARRYSEGMSMLIQPSAVKVGLIGDNGKALRAQLWIGLLQQPVAEDVATWAWIHADYQNMPCAATMHWRSCISMNTHVHARVSMVRAHSLGGLIPAASQVNGTVLSSPCAACCNALDKAAPRVPGYLNGDATWAGEAVWVAVPLTTARNSHPFYITLLTLSLRT